MLTRHASPHEVLHYRPLRRNNMYECAKSWSECEWVNAEPGITPAQLDKPDAYFLWMNVGLDGGRFMNEIELTDFLEEVDQAGIVPNAHNWTFGRHSKPDGPIRSEEELNAITEMLKLRSWGTVRGSSKRAILEALNGFGGTIKSLEIYVRVEQLTDDDLRDILAAVDRAPGTVEAVHVLAAGDRHDQALLQTITDRNEAQAQASGYLLKGGRRPPPRRSRTYRRHRRPPRRHRRQRRPRRSSSSRRHHF